MSITFTKVMTTDSGTTIVLSREGGTYTIQTGSESSKGEPAVLTPEEWSLLVSEMQEWAGKPHRPPGLPTPRVGGHQG